MHVGELCVRAQVLENDIVAGGAVVVSWAAAHADTVLKFLK